MKLSHLFHGTISTQKLKSDEQCIYSINKHKHTHAYSNCYTNPLEIEAVKWMLLSLPIVDP